MSRSQLPLLSVALIIGAMATLLFMLRRDRDAEPEPEVPPPAPEVSRPPIDEPARVMPAMPELGEQETDSPSSPMEALENAGVGARSRNPASLVGKIGDALEAGDLNAVGRLIGEGALNPAAKARLAALVDTGTLRLRRPDPVREVGEMEINTRSRWAIHLADSEEGRDRIFFDLVRKDGQWGVQSIAFPPPADEPVPKANLDDSLGIADAFLQATINQKFEKAKELVDSSKVSDAKIAGLCILFEEGGYQLRPQKALRAMFQRDNLSGYLINVLAGDGSEIAQFSMTVHRADPAASWLVSEVNLDQLLADYARRIGGGDVHYTPLLKNPKGGDTLVLYFDFDADTLTPRTQRQLSIVADLLRVDPDKKLTISGHTDALGTENYNKSLSGRRALSVKAHLVECGVEEAQIDTVAAGQNAPRQPNFTEEGEDNPDGRRVNRRSEIYLDF